MINPDTEHVHVAFIMARDPEFPAAFQGLESYDLAVFEASKREVQQCVLRAVKQCISECPICADGPHVCEVHDDMLTQTEAMLSSDDPDAPVFQGQS